MLSIYIYGTHDDGSNGLAVDASEAATQLGIVHKVHKVSKADEIAQAGILMTPAVVIEGEVLSAGSMPSVEQMQSMFLKWARIDNEHLADAFREQYHLVSQCFTERGVEYGDECGSVAPSIALHVMDGILERARKLQREAS